eukprot:1161451-Pelagomonas_calceolata.AAC.6
MWWASRTCHHIGPPVELRRWVVSQVTGHRAQATSKKPQVTASSYVLHHVLATKLKAQQPVGLHLMLSASRKGKGRKSGLTPIGPLTLHLRLPGAPFVGIEFRTPHTS